MQITIDTKSTTTGNAVVVTDLTQEIDGIPVSLIESMEEADRGEVEDMFDEDGELLA